MTAEVEAVLPVARLILAMPFAAAGISALVDPIKAWRAMAVWGVPPRLVNSATAAATLGAVGVAAGLLSEGAARASAAIAAGALLVLAALAVARMVRERPSPATVSALCRSTALAVPAGIVLWEGWNDAGPGILPWLAEITPVQRFAIVVASVVFAIAWWPRSEPRQQRARRRDAGQPHTARLPHQTPTLPVTPMPPEAPTGHEAAQPQRSGLQHETPTRPGTPTPPETPTAHEAATLQAFRGAVEAVGSAEAAAQPGMAKPGNAAVLDEPPASHKHEAPGTPALPATAPAREAGTPQAVRGAAEAPMPHGISASDDGATADEPPLSQVDTAGEGEAVAQQARRAPALIRPAPELTIGMATFDDFDGVYFTLQALRLYHDLDNTELLVVDNFGSEHTRDFVKDWVRGTYILANDVAGTAYAKNLVFEKASGNAVLCCDSHVLFEPGVIARLKRFYREEPDCVDLLQGPLVYDDGALVSTHFEPVWREQMWGIWATDPRGQDPDGEPFEIAMQGLGAFSCRAEVWPGFHPGFRGFGGEEGYLHEKVRRAGGRCLCLPWLRWMHRFGRPRGVPYPLTVEDKLRNYLLGHLELGLDTAPVLDHFAPHLPEGRIERVLADAHDRTR